MISCTQFAGSNRIFQTRFSASSGFDPFVSFCFLLMLVALGLLFSGCSKKSDAETKITAPSEASQYAPKPQPLPASRPIATTATPEEVAGQLTLELRRYVSFTRSIPKNFEDFVANDPIQFPPPPAGKKYVIVDGKVILQ